MQAVERYLTVEEKNYIMEVNLWQKENARNGSGAESAMNHCIGQNILTDILKSEKSEVLHMIFLTEYDEKEHLRHTFAEGREEGRMEGREDKLVEMIQKKYAKGKSPEVIAEELEEDLETVHNLLKRL